MSNIESAARRFLDVAVSLVALAFFAPMFIAIVVLIRLESKGAALFRQKRMGKGGRAFCCFKFRTMYLGAPDLRNPDGSAFNSEDDPRVTRTGRFLRKTSLDELPQLINVFRGEMSLVGPRPDQVDQVRYYEPREMLRLTVKPGITGLAQINGRNSIAWSERKRLDLEYVARQSLWLDLRILVQTVPYVLVRRDIFIKPTSEKTNDCMPN
jgi:undecaprenyl phosphate N,N'-diacetylbacillosamine 1-phosphate transferase